jgi:hypothetical protein
LLKFALPSTVKEPSPFAVTAGAFTPPRDSVKVWRLPAAAASFEPELLPVLPLLEAAVEAEAA